MAALLLPLDAVDDDDDDDQLH
ncbi:hypothetical protein Gotri_012091, partial [Gossypium trilobum]|nr:hypothetical protein [Gossypium laxum]MBA0762490.1 hypothetical protein [Gossypium trilobum]